MLAQFLLHHLGWLQSTQWVLGLASTPTPSLPKSHPMSAPSHQVLDDPAEDNLYLGE